MEMLLEKFDASNEEHVRWLKKFLEADVDKKIEILEQNPMKQDVPPFEVIHVMFGLCAKYTKAVFNNNAVILSC
mgnify:CR=1 FL=1